MTTPYKQALEYFEVIWRQASGVDVELNKAIRRALLIADAVESGYGRDTESKPSCPKVLGKIEGWNDCLEHLKNIAEK